MAGLLLISAVLTVVSRTHLRKDELPPAGPRAAAPPTTSASER